MRKILIICGPTATGKTSLALTLSQKLNGKIISADSRQIYIGMDIGTGKDKPKKVEILGYDLVRPDQEFSISHFYYFARKEIEKLWKKNKLPIIVGGAGLYFKSLINPPKSLNISPNPKLRKHLQENSLKTLQTKLKKLNPSRFKKMNQSDQMNPRRLIRAIEVHLNKNPALSVKRPGLETPKVDILWIGLKTSKKTHDQNISTRVIKRVKQGMTQEVKKLIKDYPNWNYPAFTACGYSQWRKYLEGKITKKEAINKWQTAERQYARRQLTWFNKHPKIKWFDISSKNYHEKVEAMVKNWYSSGNEKRSKN